jgi:hypothetical protein
MQSAKWFSGRKKGASESARTFIRFWALCFLRYRFGLVPTSHKIR